MTMGSSRVTTQREDSRAHIRPKESLGEAEQNYAHPQKRTPTAEEQLVYLQALYPYASDDDLMDVIASTDSIDEAARSAYEALNPDYTSFKHLKNQHDLLCNPKLRGAEREMAFTGLERSLVQRAREVFRPGQFSNLSQLQEYHETVQLFIVNTSDWDRAMLLPSHSVAEMTCRDLPLDGELREQTAGVVTILGDQADNDEGIRQDGSPAGSIPLPVTGAAAGRTDFRSGAQSRTLSDLAPVAPLGGKAGKKYIATSFFATAGSPKKEQQSSDNDTDVPGAIYRRKNDLPCAAPIISWAPEAIYVGPTGARWVRDDTLHALEKATIQATSDRNAAAAASAVVGEVHEPVVELVGDGPATSTVLPMRMPSIHTPSIQGPIEAHEPFGECRTLFASPGCDGIGGDTAATAIKTGGSSGVVWPSPRPNRLSPSCEKTNDRRDDRTGRIAQRRPNTGVDLSPKVPDAQRLRPCVTPEKMGPQPSATASVDDFFFRETIARTPLASSPRGTDNGTRASVPFAMGSPSGGDVSLLLLGAGGSQRYEITRDSVGDCLLLNRSHSVDGGADKLPHLQTLYNGPVAVPAACSGCSSLDPAAFLNSEMTRWDTTLGMLAPYEEVFGPKYRCELVRCIHDYCPKLRVNCSLILQRVLHVLGIALRGKELSSGLTEKLLKLPFLGSILLSTSPVKLSQLRFREEKCSAEFCEEGTRLKVRVHLEEVVMEAIEFAYIWEGNATRQECRARQSQRRAPTPSLQSASTMSRGDQAVQYTKGVTRGTAIIKAADIRVKGVMYVWLMASGKTHLGFQKLSVSLGSFGISTNVTRLNILCTLCAPILRLMVQRGIEQALRSVHSF